MGAYLASKYNLATSYSGVDTSGGVLLENAPVTGKTATSAVLHGTLKAPYAVYDVTVYWGTTDGGTNPLAWQQSAPIGSYTNVVDTQPLTFDATGLVVGTKYYFTFGGDKRRGSTVGLAGRRLLH